MDKSYIKSIVQNILNKEFKNPEKRKINEYDDRLNYACPVCQDSSRDIRAKRCNLYLDRLQVICFNCGYKSGLNFFAKRFNQQLDPSKRLEMIQHIDSHLTYKDYESDINDTVFDKLISLKDVESAFNSGDYMIRDLSPVKRGSNVHKYLLGRGIDDSKQRDIFEAKYWYNENRYEDILCFINRKGDKVLGMQVRNLKSGKFRMFKIYNYEALYKMVYSTESVDIEMNQLVVYNKISCYFNILNVDLTNTITIFEGYLDSLFFPNSIGLIGVNADVVFLENNDLDIQYFFDNDAAGHEKSDEKISKGYPVFLWKKLFEDIVKRKSNEDPYQLMYRINKIKDLNKLSELAKDPYNKLQLQSFFSKDRMDVKYIPRKEKKFYKKLIK